MRIVFTSNYFNHHQASLSKALDKLNGVEYTFVETEPMEEERIGLGWGNSGKPHYVKTYDAEKYDIQPEIMRADILITGSAPEALLRDRIRSGKLLFRYSERPLKLGLEPFKYLPRLIKWHVKNPLGKPIYMLCASAYTAADYAKFGLFKKKAYKWGYFPETKRYENLSEFFVHKQQTKILWAGRFLDWKHPDDVIEVARRLKQDGYTFSVDLIGIGDMEPVLRQRIREYRLDGCVFLLGSMKPEQVREHMEQAGIYLFTSDRQEGWGAVLNESMNSGCAVVASHAIGSVPYLLKDRENGLVYKSGNVDMLYEKVKYLLDNPEDQQRLGAAAYRTITETWNAEVAAERFVNLAQHILDGEKFSDLYADGPCSRAEIIKDEWFIP